MLTIIIAAIRDYKNKRVSFKPQIKASEALEADCVKVLFESRGKGKWKLKARWTIQQKINLAIDMFRGRLSFDCSSQPRHIVAAFDMLATRVRAEASEDIQFRKLLTGSI